MQHLDVKCRLRVLGVIVNDKLTAVDHVSMLLSSSSSLMLRTHSMETTSLHDIFRATVISQIQYRVLAWSGMCSAADHVYRLTAASWQTARVLHRRRVSHH